MLVPINFKRFGVVLHYVLVLLMSWAKPDFFGIVFSDVTIYEGSYLCEHENRWEDCDGVNFHG